MSNTTQSLGPREPPGKSGFEGPTVSMLLEQRRMKYGDSEVKRPRLSREEISLMAAQQGDGDQHRAYLTHRFDGANAQLVEEARSELGSVEQRCERAREEGARNAERLGQRTKHEITRQPSRVEGRSTLEWVFLSLVITAALMSGFVVWNALQSYMLGSGLFPDLMEFPASLSLYLQAFGAVALSFLPKMAFDRLGDERGRKRFLAALEIATALVGLVWMVCASILFSPTAEVRLTSVDLDVEGDGGAALLGSVLLFSQLLVEIGMGALLWIFGLRLNERGRLEVARESPAYTTLSAEDDVLFIRLNALEEYAGTLRGFLSAVEAIRAQFVAEELGRIDVERLKHEGLKRMAIVREIDSHRPGADTELRVVS